MSKVHYLNGTEAPTPGVPNLELVGALEDLLQKARDGEVAGVAVACYNSDRSTGDLLAGHIHPRLIANLEILKIRLMQKLELV